MEDSTIASGLGSSSGSNDKDAFSAESITLLEHIAGVLKTLLGAEKQDLERPGSLLSTDLRIHTLQLCTRFAHENHPAIYAMKDAIIPATSGNEKDSSHSINYKYNLAPGISIASSTVGLLAFFKRPFPLDFSHPLQIQIQIVTFPNIWAGNAIDGGISSAVSPYESLHSVLHHALAPYFDAYTNSQHMINGANRRAWIKSITSSAEC